MTRGPHRPSTVGVLALQGDCAAHARALSSCGATVREVRLPEQLEGIGGLVMPGGESTTLLRFLREHGFDRALPAYLDQGGALYGTCAGAILLAKRVLSPEQWSLGLLDVDIERNAYGRQIDSFETTLPDADPAVPGLLVPVRRTVSLLSSPGSTPGLLPPARG